MKIKDVIKTSDIIRIDPDESLSSALNTLGSSHDSAFVFDGDTFLGIINPYYALIKKSYPANTKVENALVKPSIIQMSDPIEKAIKHMVESKIHYLPVYDRKKFAGIVTARRILKHIVHDPKLDELIRSALKSSPKMFSISETEYLSQALTQFKNKKISKLVVTDPHGSLKGILTYYDVIQYLTEPQERQNFASRKGNKHSNLKKPVKNFMKTHVLTLTAEDTLHDAGHMILENEIGSVIVIDSNKKPIGIITTRDILETYTNKPKSSIIQMRSKGLSDTSKNVAESFVGNLNALLKKDPDVEKAEVTITEKKKGNMFEAAVSIFQKGKQTFVLKAEDHDLPLLLKDLRSKARRLIRKD